MAWNRQGPANAAQTIPGGATLGGMNDTYRPGAFFNYMGLPHGTTRTYMSPVDSSPTKKMQQLKDLLDQQLIDQSDFDAQKQTILASIVTTGIQKPQMRGGAGGDSMGQTSAQSHYAPPQPRGKPTMGFSQVSQVPSVLAEAVPTPACFPGTLLRDCARLQYAYQPKAEQPQQSHYGSADYGQGRNAGATGSGVTFGSPAQMMPGNNSGMGKYPILAAT